MPFTAAISCICNQVVQSNLFIRDDLPQLRGSPCISMMQWARNIATRMSKIPKKQLGSNGPLIPILGLGCMGMSMGYNRMELVNCI